MPINMNKSIVKHVQHSNVFNTNARDSLQVSYQNLSVLNVNNNILKKNNTVLHRQISLSPSFTYENITHRTGAISF